VRARTPLLLVSAIAALACAGCTKEPVVNPRDRAEGNYLKAQSEYLQGNFDEALKAFDEVKKDAPDDPRLPAAVGEVYLSQGKLHEALDRFQEAARRDPKRGTNWSRLGFIQAQLGMRDEAVASLAKAVAFNPRDYNALEAQAELAAKEGRLDDAVAAYRQAARVGPESSQPEWYLRAAKLLAKGGRSREVRPFLEDAVDAGSRAPEIHAALGEEQVRAGELSLAASSFEAAARNADAIDAARPRRQLPDGGVEGSEPRDPGYWEIAGQLYFRLDQLDRAEDAYRKSLAIEDRAVVHVALARLAFVKGDKTAARVELGRALDSARGDDVRETLDLAGLLADFDMKPQALMLLQNHAQAEDGKRDAELQLRTARLAKELHRLDVALSACERLQKLDAGTVRCP